MSGDSFLEQHWIQPSTYVVFPLMQVVLAGLLPMWRSRMPQDALTVREASLRLLAKACATGWKPTATAARWNRRLR